MAQVVEYLPSIHEALDLIPQCYYQKEEGGKYFGARHTQVTHACNPSYLGS
jgi:hypothetical protein